MPLSFDNVESFFIGVVTIWNSERMKRGSILASGKYISMFKNEEKWLPVRRDYLLTIGHESFLF